MKFLDDLLKQTVVKNSKGNTHVEIHDVTADSREVHSGSLFFCLLGAHVDGHDFVQSAVDKGAVAIVATHFIDVPSHVTVVYVEDMRKAMEDMVPYFFDYPSRKMRMIAVTGTNGKTTTTHMVAHILKHFGYKTGVIGTVHTLIGDKTLPAHNTTPDVIDLQRILTKMYEAKVTHVCMEVSSHALALGRVIGCEFDTAVFTNLTEDHLDFHKTMENYAKAKAILFQIVSATGQYKKNKSAWINGDDSYASVMADAVQDKQLCPVWTYGLNESAHFNLVGHNVHFTRNSSNFTLSYNGKSFEMETAIVGRFNVYNSLSAIGAALSEKVPMPVILEAMKDFKAVAGRFEMVDEGQSFTVIVDYAHTPDGLDKILDTAREITKKRVIVVFGCGGDRDPIKRPIMGRIAANKGDVVLVTSDNPRTEDPQSIVEEVAVGVMEVAKRKPNLMYELITDRHTAIERAISLAKDGDIVVIAGKGHEDYQILKDKTIHFDDREEARTALRR